MYSCKVYLKLFHIKANYLNINIIDKPTQVMEVPCSHIHLGKGLDQFQNHL